MTRYRRFLVPILWITAFIVYVLAVLPGGVTASGSDKLDHMAAFFTLAVLAAIALPGLSTLWIAAALAAFGGLIELTQMLPALHRTASMADWLADSAAIVAGLLVSAPFRGTAEAAR